MYRRWISIVLALLVLTACGGSAATSGIAPTEAPAAGEAAAGAAEDVEEAAAADAAQPASEAEQPALFPNAPAGGTAGNAPSNDNAAPFGRMVIHNATLSLLVESADAAEQRVRTLVQNLGGYILESSTSGDEEHRSVRLVFKVPVERFNDALNELENFAIKVQNRSVTGQDVTEEFVDLESRLHNLEATEARLLEFLEQAETVEEALMVNQQLTDLQGQIEQARGRIQFLQESVAYSTINVDLNPEIIFTLSDPESWSPRIAASRAWHDLLVFAQGLADTAIALAIWFPVWGLLLFTAMLVWRRFGRRGAPPQPGAQP